jgi:peptidyl-prolyl cis-trans isomerase C
MHTLSRGALASLVVLSCAVSACRKPAEEKPAEQAQQAAAPSPTPTPTPPPPPKPVPATLPDVIARVNGQPVMKAEVDRQIKQLEAQAGRPVPPEQRDAVYRGVIEQLVTLELLLQETKNRNIVVSDAEAKAAGDQKIKELRAQVPDQATFNKAMAERNMTVAKLRSDIRNDIAISRLMEAEMARVPPPTEAELKEYYDKNPNEFSGVRAAHILIRPEGFDEESKKKARGRAEDLMKQARGGADFAALAKQNSADGSAQQGGDLGFFTREQMVPPFANAAFAMQPNQISDVVETQFGFHVIKVLERKDVSFQEATEKLRAYLTQQKREEAQAALIKALRDKAKIEVLV